MPRRYLIAPDKFKGSLSAHDAAAAIAEGIRRREPDAILDLCPIADGGEGFMEALAGPLKGCWVTCPAEDALGRPLESRYLLAETADGLTAILEMAETAGLWRLTDDERNPLVTSTRGTGMQIAHAITEHAVDRIVLGLGGSATNDGGCGLASAIGFTFLDDTGSPINPCPSRLIRVQQINPTMALHLPPVVAACDVTNPLLGPAGATAVFSAQKGSTSETMPLLEAALTHLVALTGAEPLANTPGAGAAGGLGFGLLHFTHASLVSGFDIVAQLLDLNNRIQLADHVITGEGRIDHQSLSGKGPFALARLAKTLNTPVTAYCGDLEPSLQSNEWFDDIHALTQRGIPISILMSDAHSQLAQMVSESPPR